MAAAMGDAKMLNNEQLEELGKLRMEKVRNLLQRAMGCLSIRNHNACIVAIEEALVLCRKLEQPAEMMTE